MPVSTAENSINSAFVMWARIWARVVLPVPGGPQKIREPVSSAQSGCAALARRDEMFLPYEFVERAWTHAVGERTGTVGRFFAARDGLEQAHLKQRFHCEYINQSLHRSGSRICHSDSVTPCLRGNP